MGKGYASIPRLGILRNRVEDGCRTATVDGHMFSTRFWMADENEALRELLEAYDDLSRRVENIDRYADAMDDMELAPNGDDFNAIYGLAMGHPYHPPHKGGR